MDITKTNYVIIQKINRHYSRGETMVLHDADGSLSLQTVIAVPGDVVTTSDHSVTIAGKSYSYLDTTVPGTQTVGVAEYLFIEHASTSDSSPSTIKGSDTVGSVLFEM